MTGPHPLDALPGECEPTDPADRWWEMGETVSSTQDQVRKFHEAFGFYVEDTPTVPPAVIRVERARLIAEEAAEVIAELLAGLPDLSQFSGLASIRALFVDRSEPPNRPMDLAKLARELGDLEYVTNGGAVNAGINLPAVVSEIHRANMAKLDPDGRPIVNEHGKALKPPGWQPPDIAAVLAQASGAEVAA